MANAKNFTLKATSVPYYMSDFTVAKTVTVSEGVTFYVVAAGRVDISNSNEDGALLVNGTAEKPVTFTRLPGSAAYWGGIYI